MKKKAGGDYPSLNEDKHAGCFTYPEFDSSGQVIGLIRRYPMPPPGLTKNKMAVQDSVRGLHYVLEWERHPGPVNIVEGAPDAWALDAAGLPAVAIPSANSDAEMFLQFVDKHRDALTTRGTRIIADKGEVGESGASSLWKAARGLLTSPTASISLYLPPDGAKDSRDWLTAASQKDKPWPQRGEEFVKGLVPLDPESVPSPATSETASAVKKKTDARQKIFVNGNDHFRVWDQAASVLAEKTENFYAKGGELVQLIQIPTVGGDSERPEPSRLTIESLAKNPTQVQHELTRLINFRLQGKDGKDKPVGPTPGCVKWIAANAANSESSRSIRQLVGVLNSPVLCGAAGRLISRPGYDKASGLYLSDQSPLVEVPEQPTRDDAEKAVLTLVELVNQFPFLRGLHGPHLSSWMAGLVTPLMQRCYSGPTPMFFFDGNVPSLGKSTLVDIISAIVWGGYCPVISHNDDEAELRKKVTAFLIEGRESIFIDNVKGILGNGTLEAILTGKVWTDRILCLSKSVTINLNALFYTTGNNARTTRDTARRVCYCRLHSDEERPELQGGYRQPQIVDHVIENRVKYLTAALTLARGYFAAGKPRQSLPQMGSYEGWSNVVRQMIVWAGLADPFDSVEDLQQRANTDKEKLGTLLTILAEMFPSGSTFTTSDIMGLIEDKPKSHTELRAALSELSQSKSPKEFTGSWIGAILRDNLDGPASGWRLAKQEHPNRRGAVRWYIAKLQPAKATPSAPSADPQQTLSTPENGVNTSNTSDSVSSAEGAEGAEGVSELPSSIPISSGEPRLPRREQRRKKGGVG